MCGIAGVLGPNASETVLVRMLDRLVHRGPDGRGIYAEGPVFLGNQRLAIIDVPGGNQPIYNEDRSVVVVFNGEIYNYVELREHLQSRGHHLATRSDTEVLVHLYEEHGTSLVDHLRGMFAFAIWDVRRQRLMLARDRFGEKPLYYRTDQAGRSLSFASEIGALGVAAPTTIDIAGIRQFLAFGYVPGPGTIFSELNALPPAHWLTWEPDGSVDIQRYWRMPLQQPTTLPWDDWKAQVRARVVESVKLRLRSDVPVGVFLSGGIDSTVIASIAARELGHVETFSIGFGESHFNELPLARLAARTFSTTHHEYVIEPDINALVTSLQRRYGQPFGDSSAIAALEVSRLAARRLKVVLTGDGGDEAFSGYRRYLAAHYALSLPRTVRGVLSWMSSRLPATDSPRSRYGFFRRFAAGAGNDPAVSSRAWTGVFPDAVIGGLLRPELFESSTAALDLVRFWDDRPVGDLAERLRLLDCEHILPDDLLIKMDIASMSHSLEARAPFLDRFLAEDISRIPTDVKLRGGETKALLREAFADVLPAEIRRAPKRGFEIPVADWLRTSLSEMVGDHLLSDDSPLKTYLRMEGVRRLVREHHSRRVDRAMHVWTLLSLAVWLNTRET